MTSRSRSPCSSDDRTSKKSCDHLHVLADGEVVINPGPARRIQSGECPWCPGAKVDWLGRPVTKDITAEHERALAWAREQNYGSVSARYAKLCAEAFDRVTARPADEPAARYTMEQIAHALRRSLYAKTGNLAIEGIIEDLAAALPNGGVHPQASSTDVQKG